MVQTLRMRNLETEEDATFAYQRVLDATRMTSAKNNIANLEFKYEPQPPFSMREYSVASAQSGNPKGLIEGIFAINPDVTGEVGSVLYNDVNLFTAVYDQSGRMMGISSNYSNANYSAAVQRDGYGRKTRVTHSNGLVGNYGYDLLDRITNITWFGAGEDFSEGIEYNSRTGNISRITREFGTFSYGYNNLDELTGVAYSGSVQLPEMASRNLSYDYTGNRIQDNINGTGKFLRNVILEDDKAIYFHDGMGLGNLIQRTDKQTGTMELYGYYKGGKLRTYKKIETRPIRTEAVSAEYYYDALGRRISKKITNGNSFTQSFAYLGAQDKILLGKAGNGNITLYLDGQGIDEHMAMISSTGTKTFVTDHLGSVLNTEVAGTPKSYSAWGELLTTGPAISLFSDPAPYAWQGKIYDPEYGSYFSRNRTYFQEIGKFGQRDLIWPKDHLNPYVYGQNNGVRFVDPMGLYPNDSPGWDRLAPVLTIQLGRAQEIATEVRSSMAGHNDAGDAMRHAEWMRRTTVETNVLTAWVAGTGHEIQGTFFPCDRPAQPWSEMTMDLHNNAVGRTAGMNGTAVDQGALWTLPLSSSQTNPYSGNQNACPR